MAVESAFKSVESAFKAVESAFKAVPLPEKDLNSQFLPKPLIVIFYNCLNFLGQKTWHFRSKNLTNA